MFQETNLDIGGQLIWTMAPTDIINKDEAPPFFVSEIGKFFARESFYSIREGVSGYLMLYTQSGRGKLTYKDEEYELLPGHIVLIDCFQRHEYKTFDDSNGSWTFYWFHFVGEHTNFFMQMIYKNSFAVLDLGEAPLNIFEDIINNLQYSSPEYLMVVNDSVYKLLMLMIEQSNFAKSSKNKESTNNEAIKSAVAYIKINHWQPLVLEDLAKQFGMSKFYFVRLFREFTGVTPYRYMIIERVNMAKKLLQTTNMKISEISLMVGFADEGNFIRTFKSIAGVTPKTYRMSK